ncbi:isoprenoid biosynthesis glyoxalase ElbB [Candidatus Sumerlaeota bacterium]|nr:isoprenoid biosynthesis glyoxalase ElbB [Candidatus Sumerlaeota bacterium]
MASPRIGVVLSGCGVFDGAEIHEAVCTLLAIDEAGAEAVCLAPDVEFDEIDHLTQTPTGQRRSALREAARIARGKIQSTAEVDPDDLDALIFPGGFGAAKNLCDFAERGPDCKSLPEIERLVLAMHGAKKPIGFACIAPALAAKIMQRVGGAELTIGKDPGTAKAIEKMGSRHVVAPVQEAVVDRSNLIVTTPAYMLGPSIAPVCAGIRKMVQEVIALSRVTLT